MRKHHLMKFWDILLTLGSSQLNSQGSTAMHAIADASDEV